MTLRNWTRLLQFCWRNILRHNDTYANKNGSLAATIETDESRSFFLIDIPCRRFEDIEKSIKQPGEYRSDPNMIQTNQQINSDLMDDEQALDPKLIQRLKDLLANNPELFRAGLSTELNISERRSDIYWII